MHSVVYEYLLLRLVSFSCNLITVLLQRSYKKFSTFSSTTRMQFVPGNGNKKTTSNVRIVNESDSRGLLNASLLRLMLNGIKVGFELMRRINFLGVFYYCYCAVAHLAHTNENSFVFLSTAEGMLKNHQMDKDSIVSFIKDIKRSTKLSDEDAAILAASKYVST